MPKTLSALEFPASQGLEEAENQLALALSASNAALWEWDLRTDAVYTSREILNLVGQFEFGDTLAEFLSRVHPEDIHDILAKARSAIQGRHGYEVEYRVLTNSGESRWLKTTGRVFYAQDGTPLRMLGTTTDVTDTYKAQHALHIATERTKDAEAESRRLLGLLNEAQSIAKLGSWSWTLSTNEVWWSDELYKIFGKSKSTYRPAADTNAPLFHPEDAGWYMREINECVAHARNLDKEVRILRAENGIGYLRMRGEPLLDDDGATCGFVGTVQDITDAKLAEIELDRIRSQLIQVKRLEALSQMTGGIAHEFNNLLAIIEGYSGLAGSRIASGKTQKLCGDLDAISSAAKRGAVLVDKLRTYTKKSSADAEPTCSPLNAIQHAIASIETALPSHLKLVQSPFPWEGEAEFDQEELELILRAIIENACEASLEPGQVVISLGIRELDGAPCTSCHERMYGRYVSIEIDDAGIGMDSKTVSSIFDPFFTTKEVGVRTGLGLSVVHGRLHASMGHAVVNSSPGKGTNFEVLLAPLK